MRCRFILKAACAFLAFGYISGDATAKEIVIKDSKIDENIIPKNSKIGELIVPQKKKTLQDVIDIKNLENGKIKLNLRENQKKFVIKNKKSYPIALEANIYNNGNDVSSEDIIKIFPQNMVIQGNSTQEIELISIFHNLNITDKLKIEFRCTEIPENNIDTKEELAGSFDIEIDTKSFNL